MRELNVKIFSGDGEENKFHLLIDVSKGGPQADIRRYVNLKELIRFKIYRRTDLDVMAGVYGMDDGVLDEINKVNEPSVFYLMDGSMACGSTNTYRYALFQLKNPMTYWKMEELDNDKTLKKIPVRPKK